MGLLRSIIMRNTAERLRSIFGVLVVFFGQYPSCVRAMDEQGIQESSDTYLRNVANELQILNGIAPTSTARTVSRHSYNYEDRAPVQALQRFADSIAERQATIPKAELQYEVPLNLHHILFNIVFLCSCLN